MFKTKFLVSKTSILHIKPGETKLIENRRQVAVSIPGYVLPRDIDAKLFVNYAKKIKSLAVFPANSLTIKSLGTTKMGGKAML